MLQALYFPCVEDEFVLRVDERRPVPAQVVERHGLRVDLIVTDDFGGRHFRQQVAVGACGEPDFCVMV